MPRPTGSKNIKGGDRSFRLQNSKFLLTYPKHIDKETYTDWFTNLMKGKDREVIFIRLGHEIGAEDGYEHTHVVVELNKLFQSTNARIFDYEGGHCNIAPIGRTVTDWAKCIMYIAKEDPANKDLINIGNDLLNGKTTLADKVWAAKDIHDALRMAEKPGDITGILTLYNNRPQEEYKLEDWQIPTQQWQQDILNEFAEKPTAATSRKVIWYYDKDGNTGKTTLTNYIDFAQPNKWVCTEDMGTGRDAACIIKSSINKGWTGHGVIIDLPRTASDDPRRLYSILETIKNGRMCSLKYDSSIVRFKQPHLIVFANWMPMFCKLSMDRWDLRVMTKDAEGTVIVTKRAITKHEYRFGIQLKYDDIQEEDE